MWRYVFGINRVRSRIYRCFDVATFLGRAGFCVVSEKHLDHILRRAADWYNYRRCHSARGNLPPVRDEGDPPVINLKTAKIVAVANSAGT
jgi:hypothetical protein